MQVPNIWSFGNNLEIFRSFKTPLSYIYLFSGPGALNVPRRTRPSEVHAVRTCRRACRRSDWCVMQFVSGDFNPDGLGGSAGST